MRIRWKRPANWHGSGEFGVWPSGSVYHFGRREQLVNEIIRSIESRLDGIRGTDVRDMDREAWRAFLLESWRWAMAQRNRQLARLEFEATAQDIVAASPRGTAQEHFRMPHEQARAWLMVQGILEEFADANNLDRRMAADGQHV